MTTRAIYDSIGDYRSKTAKMKQISNTFVCGLCHGFRQIMGRKAMASPGRRQLFKCAVCVKAEAGDVAKA